MVEQGEQPRRWNYTLFQSFVSYEHGGSVECYALDMDAKSREISIVQIETLGHFGEFRDGDSGGFLVGTVLDENRDTTPLPSSIVTSWSAGCGPTRSTVPDGQ